MSTASDIITAGHRELNLIPVGTTPTAAQQAEGLDRLNKILHVVVGLKMGELLRDWEVPFQQRTAPVAANFPQNPYPINQDWAFMGLPLSGGSGTLFYPYPPANSRIVFGGTQAMTVYFPEQPSDGARMGLIQGALATAGAVLTLDGNSRFINGQAQQTYTVPFGFTGPQIWLYRADLGSWQPALDLALTDTMPFPEDVDDFFSLSLAMRLAPGNDKTMGAESVQALKDAGSIFKARYHQEGTTVYGAQDFPLTYESFLSGRYWW